MRNLINRWARPAEHQPMIPRFSRMNLTRNFVETGDERCPIAGIWSRLENDATADEGELTRPVVWKLLSEASAWRALLFSPFAPTLQ